MIMYRGPCFLRPPVQPEKYGLKLEVVIKWLYSALSSHELKALYVLLPPAHLYTPTPSQLLTGAYNPDTRYKAPWVVNVQ